MFQRRDQDALILQGYDISVSYFGVNYLILTLKDRFPMFQHRMVTNPNNHNKKFTLTDLLACCDITAQM